MADAKVVEVKEVPKKTVNRIFNRVEPVTVKLDIIYGDVPIEDRAVITATPADPAARDELKQVQLGWTVQQASICEMNDIPIVSMAEDWMPEEVEEPKELRANASEKKQKQYLASVTIVRDKLRAIKSLVERVAMSKLQFQKGIDASITSEETRAILAKCLKVDNYKECFLEGKDEVLKVSEKSNSDIVATMQDEFILASFYKVMHISNLTNSEVLGL